jgi:cation transport ATPase
MRDIPYYKHLQEECRKSAKAADTNYSAACIYGSIGISLAIVSFNQGVWFSMLAIVAMAIPTVITIIDALKYKHRKLVLEYLNVCSWRSTYRC